MNETSVINKLDAQGYNYRASNLSLLRDPSLRASAQDDSQSFGSRRGKEGGFTAFFSLLFSSQRVVILSAAKDLFWEICIAKQHIF
jgi:hypothetical protein